jgi:uncharacterized protein (TIGR00106 family)
MFTAADRVTAGNTGTLHTPPLAIPAIDEHTYGYVQSVRRWIHEDCDSTAGNASRRLTEMVLLEMSITPLGKGESVSQYVAECVELVEQSGLDYELNAMGTIVEGELSQVLDLMRRCIEQMATHSDRVTCAAKLDYRRGQSGRLKSKVASVAQKLGHEIRKGSR